MKVSFHILQPMKESKWKSERLRTSLLYSVLWFRRSTQAKWSGYKRALSWVFVIAMRSAFFRTTQTKTKKKAQQKFNKLHKIEAPYRKD